MLTSWVRLSHTIAFEELFAEGKRNVMETSCCTRASCWVFRISCYLICRVAPLFVRAVFVSMLFARIWSMKGRCHPASVKYVLASFYPWYTLFALDSGLGQGDVVMVVVVVVALRRSWQLS